jgi:hypothetical protein
MGEVLRAEPALVVLNPLIGIDSQQVYVYNQTSPEPIGWTVTANEPWVRLSRTSGTTSDWLTVSADTASLANGRYTAMLTFTDVEDRENTTTVHLSLTVRDTFSIYLPLVLRSDS